MRAYGALYNEEREVQQCSSTRVHPAMPGGLVIGSVSRPTRTAASFSTRLQRAPSWLRPRPRQRQARRAAACLSVRAHARWCSAQEHERSVSAARFSNSARPGGLIVTRAAWSAEGARGQGYYDSIEGKLTCEIDAYGDMLQALGERAARPPCETRALGFAI
jgi:hypothetical protein